MELTASLENYLKTIAELDLMHVRVKDLAKKLKISPSAINQGIKSLQSLGLIKHNKYSYIELTKQGYEISNQLFIKFKIIQSFFVNILDISIDDASTMTCALEHVISNKALKKIQAFLKQCKNKAKGEKLFQNIIARFGKKEEDMSLTLDKINPGSKVKALKISNEDKEIKKRVMDMGLVKGSEIEVIKVAPLGSPIEVMIRGYRLSLRKEEAALIAVEKIEG